MSDRIRTSFDFYYGKEAEQFNFFRIPKMLFKDERFKKLSSDAKILYGLLLDRMSLSIKNGWFDDENRVYIYFTTKEAMEGLNIAKEKCTKIFAELDSEKGCGLIVRKRQGLGKPDILYVMNFMSFISFDDDEQTEFFQDGFDEQRETNITEDFSAGGRKIENQEVRKTAVQKFENRTSGVSKTESLEIRKSKPNDNDINNINNNYTDFSEIYLISSRQSNDSSKKMNVMDEIKERDAYRKLIFDNIEYELVAQNYSCSSADEILEIMLDAVCSKKDYLNLNEELMPQAVVKSRLLKLEYCHIEYVLDSLKQKLTKIYNPKKYLLTALYSSFTTMDTYYTNKVNSDLYGKV